MQPINYMLDVAQPLQMALAGYTQGQGIRANQQGMEDQRRMMEMQEMQFQQQQQAIQQQQARAQEMQMDMADYAETVRSGTVTPQTIVELTSKYPEMAESIQGNWAMLSEAQKTGKIDDYTRLISALDFDPAVAMGMIDERIIAAESAGDAQQVNLLKAVRAQAEIDPAAVKASLLPELALAMDPKQFEQYIATVNPPAPELPAAVQTFEALAKLAGIQPGTPEYAEAAKEAMSGGGQTINIGGEPTGVDVTDAAFREKLGATVATEVGTLRTGSLAANRNLTILSQLETELANAPGGVEAGIKLFAGGLGIPSEGINELQAADAIISSLIPKQREEGSGSSSDKDVESFKRSLPSLLQTPEGRRRIIRNLRALNDYAVKEGAIANKLISGEFTIPQYNAALAALGNPLAPSGGAGLPVINNQAAYDALPSGAKYTTPSGGTRTKP